MPIGAPPGSRPSKPGTNENVMPGYLPLHPVRARDEAVDALPDVGGRHAVAVPVLVDGEDEVAARCAIHFTPTSTPWKTARPRAAVKIAETSRAAA